MFGRIGAAVRRCRATPPPKQRAASWLLCTSLCSTCVASSWAETNWAFYWTVLLIGCSRSTLCLLMTNTQICNAQTLTNSLNVHSNIIHNKTARTLTHKHKLTLANKHKQNLTYKHKRTVAHKHKQKLSHKHRQTIMQNTQTNTSTHTHTNAKKH